MLFKLSTLDYLLKYQQFSPDNFIYKTCLSPFPYACKIRKISSISFLQSNVRKWYSPLLIPLTFYTNRGNNITTRGKVETTNVVC